MTTTPWPAFAGIDWGGEHHQLCVVDNAGKRLTQLRVTHDVAGLNSLQGELSRFSNRMPIAIERSEGLLVEHLQALGHALFAVSPRISARARERYKVASVKDDRFDAFVLADTLPTVHGPARAPVWVRDARRELHVDRCEATPAPTRVAEQQLASALAANVEALPSLGPPVPHAVRDEARIQDRIA